MSWCVEYDLLVFLIRIEKLLPIEFLFFVIGYEKTIDHSEGVLGIHYTS